MSPPIAQRIASHIPSRLRVLPFRVIRIIASLAGVNVLVWIAVAVVLRYNAFLVSPAVLSYTFGLRHALDADHISAIDLMTRRLIASGQKPVTVGMWFSLGHSTIVIITCIVVAATSAALEERFDGFSYVGGIIGTSVSAAVLILLGIVNAWILVTLVKRLRTVIKEDVIEERSEHVADGDLKIEGGGPLVRVFYKVFRFIDRPWKMYPLGVLFGLGFDTSSEVAVLAIASIQAASGTSIWLILIFPILFTAGMCLIDTTDGALMMTLYTSTKMARDTIAILYYSIVLSSITVLVAIFIGVIQLLSLVANVASPEGPFWDGLDAISDNYDIVGGCICGTFILIGVCSVIAYGPWRRSVDRKRYRAAAADEREDAGSLREDLDEAQVGGEDVEAGDREAKKGKDLESGDVPTSSTRIVDI